MKYLLTPLAVAGMFLSFTAALVAMLFFTDAVASGQELVYLLTQEEDASRISADFVDREDELAMMMARVAGYRQEYEAQIDSLSAERDHLTETTAQVVDLQKALEEELATAQGAADSLSLLRAQQQVTALAPAFNKIKAGDAAAILAEGSLSDTLVAHLMFELQPQQVARIMGNLDVSYAAQITRLMGDLAIEP